MQSLDFDLVVDEPHHLDDVILGGDLFNITLRNFLPFVLQFLVFCVVLALQHRIVLQSQVENLFF